MERAKALQDDDYDLGSYSRKIISLGEAEQKWMDRALSWMYGFNHEAAIRCFQVVIELQPTCAFAHWGIAYCNGIDYNNQSLCSEPGQYPSNADACKYAQLAFQLKEHATPVEQMLIDAIQVRNVEPLSNAWSDVQKLSSIFAIQMQKVYNSFPDDADVCALFVESMMTIYPRDHWKNGHERQADAVYMGTEYLLNVLHSSLVKFPNHPGLLHMCIHALEKSPYPGDALPECNRLRSMTNLPGHLLHMPTHIDVLLGDYAAAMAASARAMETDRKYIARNGCDTFYSLYFCHDFHMMVYAAMLGGDQKQAMSAALELHNWLLRPDLEQVLRNSMAPLLESFNSLYLHVMVRFGRWRDILKEVFPEDKELYCVSTCMLHYARTLAYAALEDVKSATLEKCLLHETYDKVPPSYQLFQNKSRDILAIACTMAEGEVAYRRGDFEVAFSHLRQAVKLDDNLLYDEPWGWMQPARHALGALLLEQGHVEEATEVYREDLKLGHHPRNVWSLHGLSECLDLRPASALAGERDQVQKELSAAYKTCDVTIKASCYCRLSKVS